MSKVNLKGLGVALITPFKEEGSIDFEALSRLLDFQLDNGTDYIVALGTTAETPTLSDKEKVAVVRFIVEKVNGRIPVVMGIGGNNTACLVDRKSTRLNSSHVRISYAVFCLKKKNSRIM